LEEGETGWWWEVWRKRKVNIRDERVTGQKEGGSVKRKGLNGRGI